MLLKDEDVAKVLSINLSKYKSGIAIWKCYWKVYFIIVFVISLVILLDINVESSIGVLIGSFILIFISFGAVSGITAGLIYSNYNNKLDTRKICWNILSLVQEHIKRGDYDSVITYRKEHLSGFVDKALWTKGREGGMVCYYFNKLYELGIMKYDDEWWQEKDMNNEFSPYRTSFCELICYEILWPLSDIQIKDVLINRSDIDGELILKWKSVADDYFIRAISKEEKSYQRTEQRAARTGEDYWKIADEQTDAFNQKEDQFKKEREDKKEASKDAQARGLYLGVTGRCPYCNKKISKLAVRCPYCTSTIR